MESKTDSECERDKQITLKRVSKYTHTHKQTHTRTQPTLFNDCGKKNTKIKWNEIKLYDSALLS